MPYRILTTHDQSQHVYRAQIPATNFQYFIPSLETDGSLAISLYCVNPAVDSPTRWYTIRQQLPFNSDLYGVKKMPSLNYAMPHFPVLRSYARSYFGG